MLWVGQATTFRRRKSRYKHEKKRVLSITNEFLQHYKHFKLVLICLVSIRCNADALVD